MNHSNIVGGSTAKRVIMCPGSVALVAKMPPQVENQYMAEGTRLHNLIAQVLQDDAPHDEEKIGQALTLLGDLGEIEYEVEQGVSFGSFLPGVFGSADLIGRVGNRAVVLDWKFGDGVIVEAEENYQLMFYAAAAMRTLKCQWAFDGVTEVECVIIQPPQSKRWVTTVERIKKFEQQLMSAVTQSMLVNAPMKAGEHCRFCTAKPICPQFTGAVDRALITSLEALPMPTIGAYLKNADLLETWITALRGLALQALEQGVTVPGYKLVAKRATRQWTDDKAAAAALTALGVDPMKHEVVSPAQAEKLLKPSKKALPSDLVTAVSSGNTLASEDDPRPAVVLVGAQLTAALSKLQ